MPSTGSTVASTRPACLLSAMYASILLTNSVKLVPASARRRRKASRLSRRLAIDTSTLRTLMYDFSLSGPPITEPRIFPMLAMWYISGVLIAR